MRCSTVSEDEKGLIEMGDPGVQFFDFELGSREVESFGSARIDTGL